jgi:2-polyprenyl-3-methyl-5-hydroxy-6-metoxy-1,4-benzoquinol methylase
MKEQDKKRTDTGHLDRAKHRYQKERIAHWDKVAPNTENPDRPSAFYHQLLEKYYRFFIPPGLRVLELGCGLGDLLASVRPSVGVGVDFSDEAIRIASIRHPLLSFVQADAHEYNAGEPFDVVILSDLINDLWDVQSVFDNLHTICHPRTRLVLNYYNNLWRLPLSVIKKLRLGGFVLEQNWFSPHDVKNLLEISGFEVIKRVRAILLPLRIPLISSLANRIIANIVPFSWFTLTNFIIARPAPSLTPAVKFASPSISIVIPARNEAGNIKNILDRVPDLGKSTEMIFVEGHSSDNTYDTIERLIGELPESKCRLFRQPGKGKGDAIQLGFSKAKGDILIILDADLTVPPESLPRFIDTLVSCRGEFINGVRLIYPMENRAMRFLNIVGNKFFSLAFSWMLGQPIKDTLCGTKALWKKDYELIASNRDYFGNFDPFGDFDLLFGAAKLNLKISEIPIRYRDRVYGATNISRWRHGLMLLKMVAFATKRIKFI